MKLIIAFTFSLLQFNSFSQEIEPYIPNTFYILDTKHGMTIEFVEY